jgi:hypothetical protein
MMVTKHNNIAIRFCTRALKPKQASAPAGIKGEEHGGVSIAASGAEVRADAPDAAQCRRRETRRCWKHARFADAVYRLYHNKVESYPTVPVL